MDALCIAGIAADRLVLEITEATLAHDPTAVTAILRELSSQGLRIALDDFGTGYSSLSYLQELPIDILKVDKILVSPPDDDKESSAKLLNAILTLANTLGLRSVAEGVEQCYQVERLSAGGCDTAQGFLWAPPLTAADATLLLNSSEGDLQPSLSAGTSDLG
jgi:EAL domain-containing protein (putative c-di-GMP-specific phosphodiesterase class I)